MQVLGHPSVCFRGCPRPAPQGGGQAWCRLEEREEFRPGQGPPERRSSLGLRVEVTPAARADRLATLSARGRVTCAAESSQLPDAPSWPYDVTSVSHHAGSSLPGIIGVTGTASIAMITMAVASTTIATAYTTALVHLVPSRIYTSLQSLPPSQLHLVPMVFLQYLQCL